MCRHFMRVLVCFWPCIMHRCIPETSQQNGLMIEWWFWISKHWTLGLVSCFLFHVLGENKGEEQSTPRKAQSCFSSAKSSYSVSVRSKAVVYLFESAGSNCIHKNCTGNLSRFPKMLHPQLWVIFAESAGSLLMHCCSAIDSLRDVLKRFPALCCWEQGAGREWSGELAYIQYILLLWRISLCDTAERRECSLPLCNFHLQWSGPAVNCLAALGSLVKVLCREDVAWQSPLHSADFYQFISLLPLTLFGVCIERSSPNISNLLPEDTNCLDS